MQKISILALHLGYGGIEKSIAALANFLVDKYEVEIACSYKLFDEPAFDISEKVKIKYLTDIIPNKDEYKKALKNHKYIKVVQEGIKGIKGLRIRRQTMINYIKNCDSDIIISTRDIFDDWLGIYGKKKTLKIGWEHNHHHGDLSYANKIVRSCWNLDYLVLVSNSLKEYYQEELKLSNCKCIFIPNILDHIPENTSALTSKRLVSVGRLSKEKGYLDLLKIYNDISKKHSDWVLDIIGDGDQKEKLEKYIKEKKLENVTLHGYLNRNSINQIFSDSSIYLMTSFTESFGIVLLEAMASGLPCIAYSSAEGANELITSGKNGYLINNRNQKMYVKKVCDLIEDYDTRVKIGNEGKKMVVKYTPEIIKEKWFEILKG